MRFCRFVILCFLSGAACQCVTMAYGQTILPLNSVPVTNTLPWAPGVSGGITSYTNFSNLVTDYGADPTGVSDCSQALSNAVTALPANSAIFIPAGKFRLNFTRYFKPGMVIRGAGIGKTIIDSHVTSDLNTFYLKSQGVGASNYIVSGYQRGSTNLTLNTTTGITPGCFVVIQESNNPVLCLGTIPLVNAHLQMVQVQSVSGANVTLSRPIYLGFSSAQVPNIFSLSGPVTNSGIEDLTLDLSNSTKDGIWSYRSADTWFLRVAVTNVPNVSSGISLQYAFRLEVRQCYSGDNVTPNSSEYGFQVVSSTDFLIEDNISEKTSTGFLIQNGSSGGVIAYNFFGLFFVNWANCLAGGQDFHGGIPNMNLVEGNVFTVAGADPTWGANPLNTWYRNRVTAANFGTNYPTDCRNAFQLSAQNYTNNFVGNVLCNPADIGQTPTGSHSAYVIDADSAPTLFMHGNFDFFSNATQWSNSISHTLPSSYYLASKPAEFGFLAWPPIGPDVNTGATIDLSPTIPAWWRYVYGTNPPTATSIARVTNLRVGITKVGP